MALATVDTFWTNVDKQPAGCWLWHGSIRKIRNTKVVPIYQSTSAHRYAYQLIHGIIPIGKKIIRTCWNQLCVNPEHLAVYDKDDYVAIMRQWIRDVRGIEPYPEEILGFPTAPKRSNCGLTWEDAEEVRRRYAAGGTSQLWLAHEYKVSPTVIGYIIHKKSPWDKPDGRRSDVTPEERFWSHVIKTETCWLWQRTTPSLNHPHVHWEGTQMYARRIAWKLFRDPIPPKMNLYSTCDVISCVNPDHYILGRNPSAGGRPFKLPPAERTIIREDYLSGKSTQQELALKYGVSHGTISRIVRGL